MKSRRFRRIPFDAVVTMETGGERLSGELLDIALKGAMIGTGSPLKQPLGKEFQLRIDLPDSPISLCFNAELIHKEENCSGFLFLSEDLETLTHLRKLIELNTGDVETTRSELTAWLSK